MEKQKAIIIALRLLIFAFRVKLCICFYTVHFEIKYGQKLGVPEIASVFKYGENW